MDVSPAYNTHRYFDIGIAEPDPDPSNPNKQRRFQENWLFKGGDTWSGDSMAIQWQKWAKDALALDPSLTVSSGWASVLESDNLNTASNTWVFDSLNRAFHPTIDGQDGIKMFCFRLIRLRHLVLAHMLYRLKQVSRGGQR